MNNINEQRNHFNSKCIFLFNFVSISFSCFFFAFRPCENLAKTHSTESSYSSTFGNGGSQQRLRQLNERIRKYFENDSISTLCEMFGCLHSYKNHFQPKRNETKCCTEFHFSSFIQSPVCVLSMPFFYLQIFPRPLFVVQFYFIFYFHPTRRLLCIVNSFVRFRSIAIAKLSKWIKWDDFFFFFFFYFLQAKYRKT